MSATLAATVPEHSGRPAWYRDRFALAVAGAFCLLNALTVANHAMWRDEWEVFLAGRFNDSLVEAYNTLRYTGHPVLLGLCGWFLKALPGYPWPLKILHILATTTAVFLLVRWMPLTRWQRALLAFGYFPLYEYGTILRDYAPAMLAIVVATLVFILPRRRPILFGIALAVGAQISLFNIALGVPLAVAYVFDTRRWARRTGQPMPVAGLVIGGTILLAGAVLTYLQVRRPPDLFDTSQARDAASTVAYLSTTVGAVWRSFVPFRLAGLWNTNFLDFFPELEAALSVGIMACMTAFLLRRPTALLFYLLGTSAVMVLCAYLGESSHIRHHGQTFVVFLLSLLLAGHTSAGAGPRFLHRWPPSVWARWQRMFVTAILGMQVLGATLAVIDEQMRPFSGSEQAAEIVRLQSPPDIPIIGDTDFAMTSVAGCLDRPIFIACRGEYATFLKQDARRSLEPLSRDELFRRVNEFQSIQKRDVILIVNYGIQTPDIARLLLGVVWSPVVLDERYEVYRVPYRPNP